jgi:signal transduction histidine kinase/CHASE3 domain sensor protein
MKSPRHNADEILHPRQGKSSSGFSVGAAVKSALLLAAQYPIVKVLLVVVLASLIGVAWTANQYRDEAVNTREKQAQALAVTTQLTALKSSLKDAENGQRGYIISGKPEFLMPYHASLSEISRPLAELDQLTQNDPVQNQRLSKIAQRVAARLQAINTSIATRQTLGFLAAKDMMLALPNLQSMNEIRALIADAQAAELRHLQDYAAALKTTAQSAQQAIYLASALGAAGLLLLLICLRREILNTRLAEVERKTSAGQYRDLFNSIEEGFCVVEIIFDAYQKPIDQRFLEVNPAFERQSGLRNVVGHTILEYAPNHDPHWFETLAKVAKTGEAHRFTSSTKALDERFFDVYAFRLGGANSEQVAILFSDVTRRQENQTKMLRLSSGLEARVRQRTVHLEAVNQELESFSYSVSHDLRSPLNTIAMFSHLLAAAVGDKAGEKGTQYLSRIHASTELMGDLIEGLLSLAKLSHETLQTQSVDLSAIARQKLKASQELEPNRQVQIRVQEGMQIKGDHRMMAIVIQNLLSNAWKFTAMRAPARIEIGSHPGGAGAIDETVYFVKDNGAGFSMANAQNIFEVFERLHPAADFSGSGIGLANAKRAVERHGGRIWAESKENVGATFYFTLNKSAQY